MRAPQRARPGRPDLTFVGIRRNVGTRLRRVTAGEVDAVLPARAGLGRLGLDAHITEDLDKELCVPAAGQGALGHAVCEDDARAQAALERGFDVIPVGEAGGEDVAERILKLKSRPRRVLFLCGQDARPEAPGILAHGGLDVAELPVYAMAPLEDFQERVQRAPEPDAIVLGSPKAAEALAATRRALPEDVALIALGAVTVECTEAYFGRTAVLSPTAGVRGVL